MDSMGNSSSDGIQWGSPPAMALGFSGILRSSAFILRVRPKLFTALSLTLTLPLCFIILAHNLAIDPIVSRINRNTEAYIYTQNTSADDTNILHRNITTDRIRLGLLLSAYLLLILIFRLVSTAASVYSVACIFIKRPLTYRKVLYVVPKVWRRLLVTFLWAFVFVFFLAGAFLATVLFIYLVFLPLTSIGAVVLWWFVSLLFLAVLFHFTCVFNLATVVSVLEQSYGLRSIKKSSLLIKGRRVIAYSLYALYLIFVSIVVISFDFAIWSVGGVVAIKVVLALVFALLFALIDQLDMVVSTILYFSCKAYHHESIDTVALSEHLGAYSGEYVNLRASVQMEGMQQT